MERNKHERNKKYGWLVFFAVFNWIAIALAIWKIDPDNMANFIFKGSYLPMGILLTGGIFWVLSILTLNSVRALRWTLGVMAFVYLRIWGLGSILNGVLILGLLVLWEVYSYRKKPKETVLHFD
jgi:hypothetical protein